MTDYRPIPCALYSQYELAILHRSTLRLRWRDGDGVTHLETLAPEDLETRSGEEFLLARNIAGEPLRVRLDRIVPLPGVAGLSIP
jgi:Rho-binding antiterminator